MEGVITTAARHLMAAGLSGEALLAALADIERAMGAAAPASASKPKSAGALRTERWREKQRLKAQGGDAAVTLGDASVTLGDGAVTLGDAPVTLGDAAAVSPSLPLPPNENNSNPPTPTHGNHSPRAREAIPFDAHVHAWRASGASKPKTRKCKASTDTPDRPAEVSEQVWSDFLRHRAKLKADLTVTALNGFRREADRVGWPLERAIEESILRGWRGFNAEWVKKDDRGNRTGSGSRFEPDGARAFLQQSLGLE